MESVAGTVGRPRLAALVDEGVQRRLLTVVADAGFGKSTLLSSWAAEKPCAWHTVRAEDGSLAAMVSGLVAALRRQVPALATIPAELQSPRGPDADAEQQTRALAYAAVLADALDENVNDGVILVLDDLHELDPAAPATRLIEGLVRIGSTEPAPGCGVPHVPCPSASTGSAAVVRCWRSTPTALAFTVPETLAVLEKVLGDGTEELAEPLQSAVQGWPAAVRLAVEALRTAPAEDRGTRLRRALRSDGPLYDYLAEEVFAAEPPAVRRLVAARCRAPAVRIRPLSGDRPHGQRGAVAAAPDERTARLGGRRGRLRAQPAGEELRQRQTGRGRARAG